MKKAFLFALLLALAACAYVDPSITDQTVIYSDSPVRKSTLQVSIHPRGRQYRPLTAYFSPFVIQQENSDYVQLSNAFAQIFNNAWLEERLFSIMEFEPGVPYRGVNSALDRARRRGADLLILGFVPYFYSGNTIDDTAITIQINIYDTKNGMLLWTMMQSGRIEARQPDDYIYFKHEYRLSEGPYNKIIRDIAKDMAIPLKGWLPDPDANYSFANTPGGVTAGLSGTAPAPAGTTGDGRDLPPDGAKVAAKPAKAAPTPEPVRPQINGVNLDVQFDFDKATIKPESYGILDSLGEALNSDALKGRNIIVAGHTDARGDDAYNLSLSKQRAEAIKAYLVNKWGVEQDLIEAVGYGKSRPITSGTSVEDMRKNRRVEIRLAQ
jgi:OOP family OmpA-OmpF porin